MSNDQKVFLDELRKSRTVLCKRAATSLSAAWGDINNQQTEINELKAMVGCHRHALRKIADLDSVSQDECSWMAEQSLSALPKQCLASVKADAVNEFANEHCLPCITHYQVQLSKDVMHYCDKLREKK